MGLFFPDMRLDADGRHRLRGRTFVRLNVMDMVLFRDILTARLLFNYYICEIKLIIVCLNSLLPVYAFCPLSWGLLAL